jgi:hypothetical protein
VNGQTFVLHNPVQDGAVEADKQNPYILDHNPCGSSAGSAVQQIFAWLWVLKQMVLWFVLLQ